MKAISLISGGLDSLLATKIISEQGIEVIGVHFSHVFTTPLFQEFKANIPIISKDLGIKIEVFNINKDIIDIVLSPKHGYGSGINPCINCRILILKKAKIFMLKTGASFIITGEVLGQRPMSQNKRSIEIIERESSLTGLIVRPLCAKALGPSIPETKAWINRENLFAFHGRSRKPQLALAKKYGFSSFSTPAGGCLLTDPGFTRRIKESLNHNQQSLHDIELLKLGRHFRIQNKTKCIVGRNERENKLLLKLAHKDDLLFEPVTTPGPVLLLNGFSTDLVNHIKIAANICVNYCKQKNNIFLRYGREKNGKIVWEKEISVRDPQSILSLKNDIVSI